MGYRKVFTIAGDRNPIVQSVLRSYSDTDWTTGIRSPAEDPLASVSTPALGPTQPPVQWVPEALSRGKAQPERNAGNLLHLVPRSRRSRSYTFFPLGACMAVAGHSLQKYILSNCERLRSFLL
jgi:hypothetical protein